MFYLNCFCCEVNNLHVPRDKKDLDKIVRNMQLASDKKLKDQNGALNSPFIAILHHNSAEWKTYYYMAIF